MKHFLQITFAALLTCACYSEPDVNAVINAATEAATTVEFEWNIKQEESPSLVDIELKVKTNGVPQACQISGGSGDRGDSPSPSESDGSYVYTFRQYAINTNYDIIFNAKVGIMNRRTGYYEDYTSSYYYKPKIWNITINNITYAIQRGSLRGETYRIPGVSGTLELDVESNYTCVLEGLRSEVGTDWVQVMPSVGSVIESGKKSKIVFTYDDNLDEERFAALSLRPSLKMSDEVFNIYPIQEKFKSSYVTESVGGNGGVITFDTPLPYDRDKLDYVTVPPNWDGTRVNWIKYVSCETNSNTGHVTSTTLSIDPNESSTMREGLFVYGIMGGLIVYTLHIRQEGR